MKKIINPVSILVVILLAACSVSAQNNTAAEPKAATDVFMPEGNKTITYLKNNSAKDEAYSVKEKIMPKTDTLSKTPVAVPVMKELNPHKEVNAKPTPKLAPVPSQG